MYSFNKVLFSSNDDSTYYSFWPIVSSTWKTLFPGIITELYFVTDREEDDELIIDFRRYGNVFLLKPKARIHTAIQGKLGRLFGATFQTNNIVQVNDIDLLPLQSDYYLRCLSRRKVNELLLIGRDFYLGGKFDGKCPMINTTAEGYVWKKLLNPLNLSWLGWLDYLTEVEEINGYENVLNEPKQFSDESLIKSILTTIENTNKDIARCVIDEYEPAIGKDESKWKRLDREKGIKVMYDESFDIYNYIDAHLPRPLSENIEYVNFLLQKLNVPYVVKGI
jgi:hypothetical protein